MDKVGPLSGFVVGVTADRRAAEQIELLQRKGATVLHAPAIRTHPLVAEADLAAATRTVISDPPEVTLLSTGIGVRAWFEAAETIDLAEDLLLALSRSTIYARGAKASGAAVTAGLTVAWQTPDGRSAEMVAKLLSDHRPGARVAVQLDGATGAPLASAAAGHGFDVVPVPVYRWTMPDDTAPAERLITAVCERRVDAVTFTARPQIENLCAIAEERDVLEPFVAALAGPVVAVCVGHVCAQGAIAAGFGPPIVPQRHRLGSMVMTLAGAFAEKACRFELGGVPVQVQGRLVLIGDQRINLTDRERDVLAALARRPGAVLSKQQLLDTVWAGSESDPHVVEVTVGRLRQRLGSAGVGVETVVRRGYRLAAA